MPKFPPSRVLLAIGLFLAGGCATDPDTDAQVYHEALGIAAPPSVSGEIGAIGLVDALEQVNRRYEPPQIEGEFYVQSVIDRQRAIANFLPTLNLYPAYVHEAGSAGGSFRRSDDGFEMPANLELNVFRGFSDLARLYANAGTIRQRRALLLAAQQQALLDAARAFYEVLRLEGAVEVLTGTTEVQDARVHDIRTRLNAGLARPLELLQAGAQAAGTRVRLLEAQNSLRNARTALGLFTGVPMGETRLSDNYEPPEEVQALAVLQEAALTGRPELQAADAELEVARHDVDAAFGQYYPSVTLNVEYLLTANNVATEQGWTTVLRANVPILSAGRIEADVRQAWSNVRIARLRQELARRTVRSEVETAYGDFGSSGERISQLKHRLDAAELAVQQAEASYDVGLATSLDRLSAQDALLGTRLEMITQSYDRKVAYLRLLQSTGVLRESLRIGGGG